MPKHPSKLSKFYSIIIDGYNKNKTAREIIEDINDKSIYKPSQIYSIANRLCISKSVYKESNKYKDKDLMAMKLIKSGTSCRSAAKILGIDQQSMNTRLKRVYGFTVLPDGKKQIDSLFFDKIDTEEKAYWLGFLYADGYIGKDNSIELTVKKSDSTHLTKFKTDINSNHKISTKRVKLDGKEYLASKISFKDKNMVESLQKLGCTNKKSFSIEMPQLQSKELYRHFIRGFFDGDGHIEHRKEFVQAEFACSSISFCKSLVAYSSDILGIKMLIQKDNRHKNYKVSTLSRAEGFLFLQHLYNNSKRFLDRKYEQYLNICRSKSILPETLNDENGIKRGWRNVN